MISKHGHASTAPGLRSRTYRSWEAMIRRATKPAHHAYGEYAGRGVIVCERWLNSFEAFLEDMGERPDGMSLDRVDNDGPYCPENCRWADMKTQQNNKRSNVFLDFDGRRQTLTQWAEEIGMGRTTLSARLKRGLSVEEALTSPIDVRYSFPRQSDN